jgi:hypothetical protein
MKRLLRIGIVSLAAAVVLFATSQHMRAQGRWPSNGAPKASSASHTIDTSSKPVGHTLLTTYFTQANYEITAPYEPGLAFDNALDSPTTIKCPFHEGCTLEIEQSVDAGGVTSSDNWWGPFVELDGAIIYAYFVPVGETPTDESFVLVTSNQSTPLTCGKHTVQSFVYSFDGLYIWAYHINYRVYVP